LAFHSGREADHSPQSGAEVKELVELYATPPLRLHGVVLRGNTGTNLIYLTFNLGKNFIFVMRSIYNAFTVLVRYDVLYTDEETDAGVGSGRRPRRLD
jgi:hypothetical protein